MKFLLLTLILLGTGVVAGFRINVSGSLPMGIYRVEDGTTALERGSIVIVCLSERWSRFALDRSILGSGACPGGSYGVGKVVVAVSGDVVTTSQNSLLVGNTVLVNGATLARDQLGRLMPHHPWGRHTLRAEELWLYSCHPSAFDSRYFGPVIRSQVNAVVKPVLVAHDWIRRRCGRGAPLLLP